MIIVGGKICTGNAGSEMSFDSLPWPLMSTTTALPTVRVPQIAMFLGRLKYCKQGTMNTPAFA